MALASFGEPTFLQEFRDIVREGPGGTFTICSPRLEERFGPRRLRGAPLEQRHYDIARSLQDVLEERVLDMARWLHERTGLGRLCLAGGVALNCVMNARLRDEGPFEDVWVQPAAGDAGTALGAAMLVDAGARGGQARRYRMDSACLGPSYGDEEIEAFLRWSRLPYGALERGARGRGPPRPRPGHRGSRALEFGPRALGARRSSPRRSTGMQARLNGSRTARTSPWRRWSSRRHRVVAGARSPFMLFGLRRALTSWTASRRCGTDGTARIQTSTGAAPLYYDPLRAIQGTTGVPVLVNTSFNTRASRSSARRGCGRVLLTSRRCARHRLVSARETRRRAMPVAPVSPVAPVFSGAAGRRNTSRRIPKSPSSFPRARASRPARALPGCPRLAAPRLSRYGSSSSTTDPRARREAVGRGRRRAGLLSRGRPRPWRRGEVSGERAAQHPPSPSPTTTCRPEAGWPRGSMRRTPSFGGVWPGGGPDPRPPRLRARRGGARDAEFVTANCFYRRTRSSRWRLRPALQMAWREDSDVFWTLGARSQARLRAGALLTRCDRRRGNQPAAAGRISSTRSSTASTRGSTGSEFQASRRCATTRRWRSSAAAAIGALRATPLALAGLAAWARAPPPRAQAAARRPAHARHVAEMVVTRR